MRPDKAETDEQVAARVQQGDIEAFGVLVERYEQKMLRYAKKFLFGYEDAEDAAQEVFIKAFTNIRSFDPSRSFSSWAYRIAHNEFLNTIRRKKKEPLPFFDPDTLFPHPLSASDPAEDMGNAEIRALLDRRLEALDPKYREPLVLFYYEEMDYREIAEVLRIPVSTVGIRLRRGREKVRKDLTTL